MEITAVSIAAAVRSGRTSAREAVEQALDRIAERDRELLAFRVVRDDRALAEAAAIDASPDRGSMPLAGVPIAIKDNVAVAGELTGIGSVGSGRSEQASDHEVVARLRAAGAVVVGLTNVPELCVFGATDSKVGVTRNPWDVGRTPGGSSGGSAAAVAAGMVPVAHGNDGMGSIRIPAACTGLVGIKPGLGVVPADLGNGSWFDMAENGPLSTTVADSALLLSVLAGNPELAKVTLDERPTLRIGVSVKAPITGLPVDRNFTEVTRGIADLLATAGHRVTAREFRYPIKAGPAAMARWFAGAEMDARLLADRSVVDKRVARHALLGQGVLAMGGPRPAAVTSLRRTAERYFEDFDVLLTPMLAQPPLPAIAWSERGWAANMVANVRFAPFAAAWNLAGWPAMAVPAGVHRGLPLSVQLVARPGGEGRLLTLAAEIERLRPWQPIAPRYIRAE
jgi:amidase